MPTKSFSLPWNRKICRRLAIALISCFLIVFLWPAALVPAIASESLSGTWMTHFSASALYHSTRLDNAIADLAKRNINTLYPAVWDHGHTLYSSSTITKAGGSKRNPWLHTPLSGDILMAMVSEANRPEAVVSLSPHTPDFAYRKYLQNWPEWVDRKLLDEAVVQIYRSDLEALRSELA